MGDIAKTFKIGTCGKAYYATKEQLEKVPYSDIQIGYYLNPSNKCMFAFPLPEFDTKEAGEISIFHKENNELPVIQISNKNRTFHQQLVFHKHPSGGQGLNFFCDCPYHSKENVSANFNAPDVKFYLKYQAYTGQGEEMAIVGECIYCGESNIFEKHEAEEASKNLINQAEWNEKESQRPEYENASNKTIHINKAIELREIANRILKTYNGAKQPLKF